MEDELALVWRDIIEIIEQKMNSPSLDTWLKMTQPISFSDNVITIGVPNEFSKDWLQKRYLGPIMDNLGVKNKKLSKVKIELVIFPSFDSEESNGRKIEISSRPIQKVEVASPLKAKTRTSPPLNPKYTFDSFVVGNSNRLAHAGALAVARAPAIAYNPLFIYGGVGLGKTHLMQAIGHYILENSPPMRVVYISTEKFTNDMITSIKEDGMLSFRNKYRSVDILLVDDIQFLAGKERTQEEFFHTFNALHEDNRQLVISSDRPPKEIPTLEERLRSRFEWGLITDIQSPDLETRIAILQKKAEQENFKIPDEILIFIAERIQTNIRELEGALIRLQAYASLSNNEITIPVANEIIKSTFATATNIVTIANIQEVVAANFDLTISDLKSKRRTQDITYPRQIAMYLCRELTNHSLPQIGEKFGGRDHTTVIYACDKIKSDMKSEPSLREKIQELITRLV